MSVFTRLRNSAKYAWARLAGFPESRRRPPDPVVQSSGSMPDWSLENGWDRRYIVDRAQQAHRSNLLVGSILDRSAQHVIGPGYRLRVLTGDKGFNREARLMWEEWADNPYLCDSRGRHTFRQLMTQFYVGVKRDGDALFLNQQDGRVRLVNSIEIASPVGGYYRTTEADGVEMELGGRHIAYWIHFPDEVPYSNVRAAVHRLIKVPAKDCVFMARTPLGAAETRGISAFLGTFTCIEQVEGTLNAWGVKAQVAARFAMVLEKKSPIPTANFGDNKNGITKLAEGTLTRLGPDESLKAVQGADPSSNLLDLIKIMVRVVGARFCLSLASITLDHADHNFSNARASAIETNAGTLMEQKDVVCPPYSDIRNLKLMEWIKAGRFRGASRKTLEQALRHEWSLPARAIIDPLTERQADLLALDMGTITWDDLAAREGKTAGQLFRRQAAQRKRRAALDLPDVRSTFTREETPEPMPPADDSGKPTKKAKKGSE